MAVFKCRILLNSISLLSVISLLLIVNVVLADDCEPSCGVFEFQTLFQPNQSCVTAGEVGSYPQTIHWDDGSHSVINFTVGVQLVVGSCCSAIKISFYGTGVVTSGKFSGEKLIVVLYAYDDRQACNGCRSSVGLSRISYDNALLSIGTRGVGNWIECTFNGSTEFSPALTGSAQNIYRTYSGVLRCNNCVESC